MVERQYRAGDSLEDFCRVCKTDRMHTVIAADAAGVPHRVVCGYCQSEHNYRGGPRVGEAPERTAPQRPPSVRAEREVFPIVSERERIAPPISEISNMDIEMILRRVIREEAGITAAAPAEKWRGGSLVLKPGNPSLQEKSWPIE